MFLNDFLFHDKRNLEKLVFQTETKLVNKVNAISYFVNYKFDYTNYL